MSLATFKKKSINSASTATKISGKRTSERWIYQGPYGRKSNLPSYIFTASLEPHNNAGFSITGPYRNVGGIGQNMKFSKSGTPYRGIHPKGWGGTFGRYPDKRDDVILNITPVETGVANQSTTVKPPVLSNRGMLERRFRWINSGQYPNYWVQPVYTGNQTDTASQGLYVQNKAAANYCHYDVNNAENYVNYYKTCGSSGCQTTPARGYTIGIQQANAPYTKTLHQPKDSSDYTLRIQRRCQNPLPFQKPFPYAVQTGTGVLRGGINVNNVASACNTSNTVVEPPNWYTELDRKTVEEQLDTLRKKVLPTLQAQVYDDLFLKGTSSV